MTAKAESRWLGALPYYGGKSYYPSASGAGPWIGGMLPWEKNQSYVEPFMGMLGVLLNRDPVNSEIVNDVNDRLVNWWLAVRDHPVEFEDLIFNTPRSRSLYADAAKNVDNPELTPIQRALMFHIVLSQSMAYGDGGVGGGKTGAAWLLNRIGTRKWRQKLHKRDGLQAVGERTWLPEIASRIRDIQIENRDAVDVLEGFSSTPEAMIYCDPPYRSSNTAHYRFAELDVGKFSEIVSALPCKVAISGYGDEWDHLGWERNEFEALARLRPTKRGREKLFRKRIEVLWTNYAPPRMEGKSLFLDLDDGRAGVDNPDGGRHIPVARDVRAKGA